MLKFLRRVFIVLILLLVVFVVYRFINPDGANRLVDKIKSIPTSIGIVSKNKIKLK
jgi:regulatory protein YycI of two-component signal transduction system YycFG